MPRRRGRIGCQARLEILTASGLCSADFCQSIKKPRRRNLWVFCGLSAALGGGISWTFPPPLLASAPRIPTEPELVGTLPYATTNGPTRYIVVQVGDGGSGPYKSVLMGDPNLATHTLYRPR